MCVWFVLHPVKYLFRCDGVSVYVCYKGSSKAIKAPVNMCETSWTFDWWLIGYFYPYVQEEERGGKRERLSERDHVFVWVLRGCPNGLDDYALGVARLFAVKLVFSHVVSYVLCQYSLILLWTMNRHSTEKGFTLKHSRSILPTPVTLKAKWMFVSPTVISPTIVKFDTDIFLHCTTT